jgi:adenosine deaminase
MRHRTDSLEWAELAIDFRERGVVGFDLAGEEAGYPPKKHADAFQAIQRANFYSTLHAGEAFGVASIWQALQICGAHRLGHATRLTDDMTIVGGRIVKLGSLAQYILDRRIPLEMCLSSNVHTGAVRSMAEHPFKLYYDRGFRVTLNTDDRLMSDTSMTKEFSIAVQEFGLGVRDLEKITINAMKSAFLQFDGRLRLIYEVIKPGFDEVR